MFKKLGFWLNKLTTPIKIIEMVLCGIVIESFARVFIPSTGSEVPGHNAVAIFIEHFALAAVLVLMIMVVMALIQIPALIFSRWKYALTVRSWATLTAFVGYLFLAIISLGLFGLVSFAWANCLALALIAAALHLNIRLVKMNSVRKP